MDIAREFYYFFGFSDLLAWAVFAAGHRIPHPLCLQLFFLAYGAAFVKNTAFLGRYKPILGVFRLQVYLWQGYSLLFVAFLCRCLSLPALTHAIRIFKSFSPALQNSFNPCFRGSCSRIEIISREL
ncbi:MAG: hypothetical protein EHM20_09125 [Alphaproteobacteria bacterium]|nr:MAG: hypothetical protein EHM20_09125 [Alphaproteobacteria bacterium]